MTPSAIASIGVVELVAPILVAFVFIALASLVREPHRHEFNAIMVAGAGAAYLGAGLGPWAVSYTHLTLPTIYSV